MHDELTFQFSREITLNHQLLMTINKNNAEERIAIFLLDLSCRSYLRGFSEVNLHLSMSRKDIGNYLGVASETVSRILTKFEREGVININGKDLKLIKIQSLEPSFNSYDRCAALFSRQ